MKFKYTFDVKGKVKPDKPFPIRIEDLLFEFSVENGFFQNIQVSFHIEDSQLPKLTQNPQPNIALDIAFQSPRIHEIEEIMRHIEGMLAFYGLDSIDIQNPKHEWIPEDESEKNKLQLQSFTKSSKGLNDHEIEPLAFDLIARPIIAAVKAKRHNVLQSFNKRGRVDIKNEEYIEAIYNFYFVIESYYGAGKNKNYAVEKALNNSPEFIKDIQSVLSDKSFIDHLTPELRSKFEKNYLAKSVEQIISGLIAMRGLLHHYTSKRKQNWHPDKQYEYQLEAYFLEQLSHNVTFKIMIEDIFADDVMKLYSQLTLSNVRQQNPRSSRNRFKWF